MGYRVGGFALGFLLVVVLAWWQAHSISSPKVLSETEGAIAMVEIQYTLGSVTSAWVPLSSFFDRIDPRVEVIAVCSDAAAEKDIRKKWRWANQLRTTVVGAEITGWSKDRFLVRSDQPPTLLNPAADPDALSLRGADNAVASRIALAFPRRFQVQNTDVVFDAGDILCSGGAAFFNDELWRKNGCPQNFEQRVEQMTGLKPVWLIGTPLHHIGMFAAPLHERTVIVGDPALGKQLWSAEATKQLGAADFSESATKPFMHAIAHFEKAGYRVVRVPTCVFEPKVYLTYTNGIFEHRDGSRVVYLPTYGVPSLDGAAVRAYRSLGWEVQPIPVQGIFRARGTIGCLVNVLERR